MKFKFYHGTSDIFLDSIMKNGLGGINPNFEEKHLETLNFLFELAEKNLISDKRYLNLRTTTNAMVNQAKLSVKRNGKTEILNFKHDGIFIALSEIKALIYACNNKYGSEIVTRAISIMALLDQRQIDYTNDNLAINKFQRFRIHRPKPLIIKINNVNEERLDKEDGKTAKEALDLLRSKIHLLNESERFEFFQHCNFKILDSIPSTNLEFYTVDFKGAIGQSDFSYTKKRLI